MIKIKICGITNTEDAVKACENGADLIGLIFVPGALRTVNSNIVKAMHDAISPGICGDVPKVGLFMNEDTEEVADTVIECGLNVVQLHGEESPEYCRKIKSVVMDKSGVSIPIIKAFKVDAGIVPQGSHMPGDYDDVDYFVFDTFHRGMVGGTGITFDWEILAKEADAIKKPFFVAGGLTPGNVKDAIEIINPYGVDVSSGVEKEKGKKDVALLKEFIQNAKNT